MLYVTYLPNYFATAGELRLPVLRGNLQRLIIVDNAEISMS